MMPVPDVPTVPVPINASKSCTGTCNPGAQAAQLSLHWCQCHIWNLVDKYVQ